MDEVEISKHGNLLMYKKGYSASFIRTVIEQKLLNGLFIFDHLDPLDNIDFLYDCLFLRGLFLTLRDDHEFNFLERMNNLEYLSINRGGSTVIDLSHQQNLKNLSLVWRKNRIIGISNCVKLEDIGLIEYTEKNLLPVSGLLGLKDMRIKTSSIKDLTGVEKFKLLETILLGNCRSLESVKQLNGLQRLKKITIDTCSKIKDYSSLSDLPSLEKIKVWPATSQSLPAVKHN